MTLLELLCQELPKRGGWPKGVDAVEQDSEGRLFEMDSDYCSDFKLNECDDWLADVVTKQQYESALAALQKPTWDGEGLPPVGVECEYMKHTRSTGNNWSKGTVKYISEYTVVIDDDDVDGEFIAHPLGCAFRPLRTEAERAIDEMVRLSGVSIGAAKILYDAGYRK